MKVSHLDKQLHRLTATGPRCDAEALVEHALLRVGRGAADTVSVEGVMQAYRRRGLGVASLSEIHDLAVEDIDQVAGRLCFKYQAMAIGEGLGVGFAGLPPSVVDIPALIGLSMRALAEIAAYYGYDVSQTWEQKFALMVLVLAAGPHDTGAQIDYALGCSGPGTDHAPLSARLRRQVTETLVGALMQAKQNQVVPSVGPVKGAAFNKEFIDHVCQSARAIYRERWLTDRYSSRLAAAE